MVYCLISSREEGLKKCLKEIDQSDWDGGRGDFKKNLYGRVMNILWNNTIILVCFKYCSNYIMFPTLKWLHVHVLHAMW